MLQERLSSWCSPTSIALITAMPYTSHAMRFRCEIDFRDMLCSIAEEAIPASSRRKIGVWPGLLGERPEHS